MILSACVQAKTSYLTATTEANTVFEFYSNHNMIPTIEKPILYDINISSEVKDEGISKYRTLLFNERKAVDSYLNLQAGMSRLNELDPSANKSVIFTATEELKVIKKNFEITKDKVSILDGYIEQRVRELRGPSPVNSLSSYGSSAGMENVTKK
jgi:hypothetical protein